jgi:hypothetical protein
LLIYEKPSTRLAMGIKPAPLALNCCLQKLFRKHAAEHPQDVALMRAFNDAS